VSNAPFISQQVFLCFFFTASDSNHVATEPPCFCIWQSERALTAIVCMPRLGEHFKYPKYRIMKECSASEKKLFGIDHFYEACDIFW